jgi:hypothetical protein
VLLFLCMYEIYTYVAVYMRSYNVGCLKIFVYVKFDVLVLHLVNLQCCFFCSVIFLKIGQIFKTG